MDWFKKKMQETMLFPVKYGFSLQRYKETMTRQKRKTSRLVGASYDPCFQRCPKDPKRTYMIIYVEN